jgi:hypothetical protein
MEWIRAFFFTLVFLGGVVWLHYSQEEWYAPVRQHAIYEDFVTPVIEGGHGFIKPYIALYQDEFQEGDVADGSTPSRALRVFSKDKDNDERQELSFETAEGSHSEDNKKRVFTEPSQMGFSLTQLGRSVRKRSVLSTEGADSTYFEMPDGSRLWLDRDAVVEVGWTDSELSQADLLLRIERGVMHVERPGGARGKLSLVTNSGVRYVVAPGDMWMASSQMGALDKESFPDAEQKVEGRFSDYVRRATLAETRALARLLKSDHRREVMLYQDQLRLVAEEENSMRRQIEKTDFLPAEVASIPLEIPSRRAGVDMGRETLRAPASLAGDPADFPLRGPASLSSVDEGTRVAAESKIYQWTDSNRCSRARSFYRSFLKENAVADADPWKSRMDQHFSQRCP